MTGFKSKFIVQFIIDSLVLGVIFFIVFRLLAAVGVSAAEGTGVCLPIVLSSVLSGTFASGIAVFVTQRALSKKGVDDAPQPIPFYLILAAVLFVLTLLYTILGFSVLEGYCRNNISITVPADTIRPAVTKAVVIANIAQAVILAGFVPFWKKCHEKLF